MSAFHRVSDLPYRISLETVDVQTIANREKKVPDSWLTEDGMHVTDDFAKYARPLIQAELTPVYVDGLPRHLHL